MNDYYDTIKHLSIDQLKKQIKNNCCCSRRDQLIYEACLIRLKELGG